MLINYTDQRGNIMRVMAKRTRNAGEQWFTVIYKPGQKVPRRLFRFGLPKRLTALEAGMDLERYAKRKSWSVLGIRSGSTAKHNMQNCEVFGQIHRE